MIKYKTILIISAIAVVVFGFAFYAYTLQQKTIDDKSPEIFENLIKPYCEELKAGNREEAYEKFTSRKYRSKHSLENFIKAQNDNAEYYGELDSMSLTSGIFVYTKDLERNWVYRGTINYYAAKMETKFTVDVIQEDSVYKISSTYPSQLTIRASAPQIF